MKWRPLILMLLLAGCAPAVQDGSPDELVRALASGSKARAATAFERLVRSDLAAVPALIGGLARTDHYRGGIPDSVEYRVHNVVHAEKPGDPEPLYHLTISDGTGPRLHIALSCILNGAYGHEGQATVGHACSAILTLITEEEFHEIVSGEGTEAQIRKRAVDEWRAWWEKNKAALSSEEPAE